MARSIHYSCSKCKRGEAEGITRANLYVKRVQFSNMGEGAKVIRSRVLGWICEDCVEDDPDFNRVAGVEAGGTISG